MIINLLTLAFAAQASYSNVYSPGMMSGGIQSPQPSMTGIPNTMGVPTGMMASSYTLSKANMYCKNHRMTSNGELLQSETIVLANPLGSVQSCYATVLQARNLGCGATFMANNAGSCACLRPQVQCRSEGSKTGLGIYQLSGFLQKAHHSSENSTEEEPVLGKAKVMPVAGTVPGQAAYNPMYPNAMQTGMLGRPSYQQMNVNRGCDNELEDSTDGLPPVHPLGTSPNADQCAVSVQAQQRMGICGDMFMFTQTTMGCSCIRAGQFCDDESMPGTTLYKSMAMSTPGMVPGAMTGAGMMTPGMTTGMTPGMMTPGVNGMTGMTGTGMMPGMTTGMGMNGMATGMRPGMTAGMGVNTGMAGYGTTGMMPNGMNTGMATGMGMAGTTGMMTPTTGMMTPTTGMMTPGMAGTVPGVYPHVLQKAQTEESTQCAGFNQKPACEERVGCMWSGDSCSDFVMEEEGEAFPEKLLFYCVVPISLVCVTLALICGARRCSHGSFGATKDPESLLMEDKNDHIVPVV